MNYLERVKEFTRGCRDVTAVIELDSVGNVMYPDELLTLSETAKSQLCSFAGCTTKFFDILREEGLCRVINKVLKDTQYLLRLRRQTIRGILSTSYKPIDNIDVCEKLVPYLKLGILGKVSEPVWETLTDEFSILRIDGAQRAEANVTFRPSLLISNSEVGKAALNLRLSLQTDSFRIITDPIVRKIHLGPFAGILTKEELVTTFESLMKSLPHVKENLTKTIRFRSIDFKLLHYPNDVMKEMFGMTRRELTEARIVDFSMQTLAKATISDKLSATWRYILGRDFFDLLVRFNRYIHDGWVVKWPHHVR